MFNFEGLVSEASFFLGLVFSSKCVEVKRVADQKTLGRSFRKLSHLRVGCKSSRNQVLPRNGTEYVVGHHIQCDEVSYVKLRPSNSIYYFFLLSFLFFFFFLGFRCRQRLLPHASRGRGWKLRGLESRCRQGRRNQSPGRGQVTIKTHLINLMLVFNFSFRQHLPN